MRFTHGILGFALAFSALQISAEVTELDTTELESAFVEGITSSKEKQSNQQGLTEKLIEDRITTEEQASTLMDRTMAETLLAKTLAKDSKLPTTETPEFADAPRQFDFEIKHGTDPLGQITKDATFLVSAPESAVFSQLFNKMAPGTSYNDGILRLYKGHDGSAAAELSSNGFNDNTQ